MIDNLLIGFAFKEEWDRAIFSNHFYHGNHWWIIVGVNDQKTVICWYPFLNLKDLRFTEDLRLLAEKNQHIENKPKKLADTADEVVLRIKLQKTK